MYMSLSSMTPGSTSLMFYLMVFKSNLSNEMQDYEIPSMMPSALHSTCTTALKCFSWKNVPRKLMPCMAELSCLIVTVVCWM